MTPSERGKRGIRAAIAKNPEHQREAGRLGFAATVARHWGGSKEEYLKHQRARANQSIADALADIQIAAELRKGNDCCVELPVYLTPDEDPTYWRDRASRDDFEMPF